MAGFGFTVVDPYSSATIVLVFCCCCGCCCCCHHHCTATVIVAVCKVTLVPKHHTVKLYRKCLCNFLYIIDTGITGGQLHALAALPSMETTLDTHWTG
jgi:hypothetical protein